MFYRCSSCNRVLTEFDVNFTKKLKGSLNEQKCQCARCIVNNGNIDGYYTFEDKMALLKNLKIIKPNIFKYLFPYPFLLFILIFSYSELFGMADFIDKIMYSDYSYLVALGFLGIFVGYIVCVALCVKDFNLVGVEGSEYTYYETVYNEVSKSYESRTKTGYEGGDSRAFEKFLLFLSFPFWGIFRYLYLRIKFGKKVDKEFTKEMIGAYKEAVRSTEKFKSFDKTLEEYDQELGKYNAAVDTIKSKYAYLDGDRYNDAINKEIKKLKEPAYSTIESNDIHHGTYKLVCISDLSVNNERGYWSNVLFVVNGIGKKIIIPSISKEYAAYITSKNKRKKIFNIAMNGLFDREKGIIIDSIENPGENG